MVWRSRPFGAVVGAAALAVIAGCAPSVAPAQTPTVQTSASEPPNSTPTPTPTWNADQSAAIDVVAKFGAANLRIQSDPVSFTKKQMTELLEPLSGGEALQATVKWQLRLKEKGYRVTGQIPVLSVTASRPADDGRGMEVHVTQCQDQREGKVVDRNGNPVSGDEFEIPAYNLRQYSVRKPPGENAFRVFGYETINGACPS